MFIDYIIFYVMWNLYDDIYIGLIKLIFGFGIGYVVIIFVLFYFFYLKVEELDMLYIVNIFVVL